MSNTYYTGLSAAVRPPDDPGMSKSELTGGAGGRGELRTPAVCQRGGARRLHQGGGLPSLAIADHTGLAGECLLVIQSYCYLSLPCFSEVELSKSCIYPTSVRSARRVVYGFVHITLRWD